MIGNRDRNQRLMTERKKKPVQKKNTAKKKPASDKSVGVIPDSRTKQRKKAEVSHERIRLIPAWFSLLIKLALVVLVFLAVFFIYLDSN